MQHPQQFSVLKKFQQDYRNNQILWKYDKSSSPTSPTTTITIITTNTFLRTLPQYLLAFKNHLLTKFITIEQKVFHYWFARKVFKIKHSVAKNVLSSHKNINLDNFFLLIKNDQKHWSLLHSVIDNEHILNPKISTDFGLYSAHLGCSHAQG